MRKAVSLFQFNSIARFIEKHKTAPRGSPAGWAEAGFCLESTIPRVKRLDLVSKKLYEFSWNGFRIVHWIK
jgi:hypothetical protein